MLLLPRRTSFRAQKEGRTACKRDFVPIEKRLRRAFETNFVRRTARATPDATQDLVRARSATSFRRAATFRRDAMRELRRRF